MDKKFSWIYNVFWIGWQDWFWPTCRSSEFYRECKHNQLDIFNSYRFNFDPDLAAQGSAGHVSLNSLSSYIRYFIHCQQTFWISRWSLTNARPLLGGRTRHVKGNSWNACLEPKETIWRNLNIRRNSDQALSFDILSSIGKIQMIRAVWNI